jgi:hypothetical protein
MKAASSPNVVFVVYIPHGCVRALPLPQGGLLPHYTCPSRHPPWQLSFKGRGGAMNRIFIKINKMAHKTFFYTNLHLVKTYYSVFSVEIEVQNIVLTF